MKKAIIFLLIALAFSCATPKDGSGVIVSIDSTRIDSMGQTVFVGKVIKTVQQEVPVYFTKSGILDAIQQTSNQLEVEIANYNGATSTINNNLVSDKLRSVADSMSVIHKANIEVMDINLSILKQLLSEINKK